MAGRARTKHQDAGGATDSSPSTSVARGLYAVDGAKPKTNDEMLAALDELTPESHHGPVCRMSVILLELDENVRARVIHLIDETNIPASKIANVFAEFGYTDVYRSLSRHRRRKSSPAMGCRCP